MRRLILPMLVAAAASLPGIASAQSGDAAAGQRVFNQCRACHTADQGGRNGVGPNLFGIVGRKAASIDGFRYSANMRSLAEGGLEWNEDRLRAYITNPKAVVPQGSMSFPGLRNETQLNDLIAYLSTLK
ncbi:c-type cytochrome [Neoroseomonas oryzicola]|uniref:Cytochrome c family protein n=1 Tax=Neoroseomonas oryzicola TaxID=535904 RepID=A0A9X9WLJ7_9PROT|nr:cytochrome c family protein [Neoroseomonas oryzicola]MBR0661207.1 cytochrome c family protein [Neoroseomonas oryzicola]NKE17572.1 cytochrome c family protein [Neoroseomonas oryzicola]